MKITATEISVGDLVEGYFDDNEDGVVGYDGKLDIRPAYQRAFRYSDKQQQAVIHTALQGFPLNTMYWVKNIDPVTGDERFEVLDGQQRTISLALFCQEDGSGFAIVDEHGKTQYFHNLPQDVKDRLLGYKLQVYVCEGSDSERLDWFRVINTAGEVLTEQELLNANYAGRWLTDAKRFFSRTGCPAANLSEGLVKGVAIKQELLAKALGWLADRQGLSDASAYMAAHAVDKNADELKQYYQAMIAWVEAKFPTKRRERQGQDWGRLFNEHGHRADLDAVEMEDQILALLRDDEVQKKSAVYEYVLLGGKNGGAKAERLLNLRQFSDSDKSTMYARQGGKCAAPDWSGHDADDVFVEGAMEADHVVPWSKGGRTELSNGQMLCGPCNREKRGQ